ncbi:Uncharacterized protein FWK35_00024488 [Aphis craccivora]|uniref:Uncharacterized protein n=1 Tax=Aphis craccivora TaxID=307492 RepID=A0A6G0YFH9_APHCR|nr:Uncharacterized protein FWK35_00024488 [Aphis craccivora]
MLLNYCAQRVVTDIQLRSICKLTTTGFTSVVEMNP